MKTDLEDILSHWALWYRLRRGLAGAVNGLIFGGGMALGFSLAILLKGRLLQGEFLLLLAAAALISMAAGALLAFFWRLSPMNTARFFDVFYGLKERASTALELSQQEGDQYGVFLEKQRQDALQTARQVNPTAHFFWQVKRSQVFILCALLAAIIFIALAGAPLFRLAEQKRLVQQAIQAEIEELEAIQEQVKNYESLTPEQQEELSKALEEAVQELRKAETPEQAVAALTSAENKLQALADPQAQQKAEALQQAGKQLQQSQEDQGSSALESFAQDLADGDTLAAAQDLQNLDVENMSPEEQSALADQLEQAAAALEDTNPELAQQLNQAAQALRAGDAQSAQQALSQAAQTLSITGQQIAQAGAAQQAAAQVGQGKGRMIQAGANAQSLGSQPGQSQGQGQGSGQAQGQGSGSGQGSEQNQGQGGSGAGSGHSEGDAGAGPEAGSDPISQNNKPGDGGLAPYEPVYAPQRLGGSGGEEVLLPGGGEPGEEVVGQGNTSPGDEGAASVPYTEVFPAYADAYRQAVESGQVPPALRPLVKKYFSSLEP